MEFTGPIIEGVIQLFIANMAKSSPDLKSKISKKWKVIIGIVAFLIAVRIALPYIVLHYANKRLAEMPGILWAH